MPKKNWYKKPEVARMTNDEVESVMRQQDSYFDTYPNAWNTNWSASHVTEATIHDDEGRIFFWAKRLSKNRWQVQTTFN